MPKIVAQKKDWIKLGYKLFSEQGFSGIVIEKMSKKIKCNKSSFYWHFKTKKEFIEHLVEYWVNNETEQIIKLTSNEKLPSKRLKALLTISYKQKLSLDFVFFLKRYARREKKVRVIIDRIDTQRIEYVKSLLQELGYAKQEAKVKASVLYKHLIGHHEMLRYKEHDKNYLQEVKKELNQFIEY